MRACHFAAVWLLALEPDALAQHGVEHGALIPMSRQGSGTSWVPDTSAHRALVARAGSWRLMVHGNLFVGLDSQASHRGDVEAISTNWLGAMASHGLAGGEISGRAMLSLEPLTVGADGYPLLLQSGETYRGAALHDRQHPHDLLMEAAISYLRALPAGLGVQVYLALAGEPALGPTAFPHRPSAVSDPLAPLGHHWQDSTHISYGVGTLGLFTGHVKVEASFFNGREPDEERYDVDLRAPDSLSTRISLQPVSELALQLSYGRLASPEALHADESVHRWTASAMCVLPLSVHGRWAATLVWGRNAPDGEPATDALLLESDLDLDGHHTLFGRIELGTKTNDDLVISDQVAVHRIAMLVAGYVVRLGPWTSLSPGIGVRGSIGVVGESLEPSYGTRTPFGAMVFLQLVPSPPLTPSARPGPS
ncbi:MAG: hypothetical protein HYY06_10070 [Deltaproteobacteria bacterium]|nr:hypothetical protein [Deltaproteobacteria bacterium]